jgi:hypothetical protein
MALKMKDYSQIRTEVKPGDIIAFGGKGNFSQLIKWPPGRPYRTWESLCRRR